MGIQIKCVYVPSEPYLQKDRRKLYNSTAFFYIHQFINGLCLVLVHTPFINLVPGPVCFHSFSLIQAEINRPALLLWHLIANLGNINIIYAKDFTMTCRLCYVKIYWIELK